MIREIFKMLKISTQWTFSRSPVNQCLSHLIQFLVECWAVLWECRAAKMGRRTFGTHMVYRETFLQIQQRLLQHLIRKNWIHGVLIYKKNTHHLMWWVKAKHQFRIRDASQDRQPEIQSSLVREILQRIMEQTNNDCRSQIFILTNSPTPATFAKIMGIISRLPRLRWTSSRRSICLYPSKKGRCSQIIENSQIGVSRHLDSSTTTQMA